MANFIKLVIIVLFFHFYLAYSESIDDKFNQAIKNNNGNANIVRLHSLSGWVA